MLRIILISLFGLALGVTTVLILQPKESVQVAPQNGAAHGTTAGQSGAKTYRITTGCIQCDFPGQ